MQVKLGGEADVEDLLSERWIRGSKNLTAPAIRVYEWLVTQYSDGLEEIDLKVLAKHTNTTQNALIKDGGILEELESKGLVDRALVE